MFAQSIRVYLTLVLGFCLSSVLLAADKSPVASGPGEVVEYFADNGWGNALAVVQHPAGEYRDGITYVAYQGPLEDPYVAAYHHETGLWKGPYQAGVSELGKNPNRAKKIDNHGKPTMIIDDAGFIHVFFGGHGGLPSQGKNSLGDTHDGRNKHAVSKRPFDITAWAELDNIPPFGTYNQAIKMDNGDLYLFYRHGAHRSDWVYQKSTDNGRTFSPPVSFLKHQRRDDLAAVDSWYAWVGRGEGDDIMVGYDYHLCWDADADNNGLGHTTERRNVFYMVMDTQTNTWRNVQGEALEMPIVRKYAKEKTLVASTDDLWTFNGSTHLDEKGNPHIGVNIGEHLGLKFGGPKRTSHFRWTGNEWVGGRSDLMPEARGDFVVSTPGKISFLIGYREEAGDGVVAWWNSADGGASFAKGEELLRRDKAGWSMSSLIRNAHPDARVLVAEKTRGSDWARMYLLGDKGPVTRPKIEAAVLRE